MAKHIFIEPIMVQKETEKAILLEGDFWLPKSQVILGSGYVLAVAAWLYHKNKDCFAWSPFKTVEESEQWLQHEIGIEKMMEDDPTLHRCRQCGCLFHIPEDQFYSLCENCDVNRSVSLQKMASYGAGTMTKQELKNASIRDIVHNP
ncbi:MAG: hypothetical protein LBI18_10725 [Planctomycetaceae bacterium]|jgi:hypothetical protein|nr:hypothetical protein [Planctomycetaceae bacterium]